MIVFEYLLSSNKNIFQILSEKYPDNSINNSELEYPCKFNSVNTNSKYSLNTILFKNNNRIIED